MMIPTMAMFLVIPISAKAQQKLFGPDKKVETPEIPSEVKQLKSKLNWISIILAACGFLLLCFTDKITQKQPLILIIKMVVIIFISSINDILEHITSKKMKLDENHVDFIEITSRLNMLVDQMALLMGVRPKKVKIWNEPEFIDTAMAAVNIKKELLVTPTAMKALNDAELNFILAHELAHLKEKHIETILLSGCMILCIFMPLSGAIGLFNHNTQLLFFCIPAAITLMFAAVIILHFYKKRRELIADQTALEITRNFPAAESALRKLAQHSPQPYLHEYDTVSTHPALSKRINRLKQIAKEIGCFSEDMNLK
jgi:Zn-dependent protease with chaperone function